MLLKLRQRMASDQSGFTLVELLVVMLILGLLAAIAIPSFFNQRDKAKDADAKEGVRTAQTAMETWATDHDGKYDNPAPTAANLGGATGIESTIDEANLTVGPTAPTANSYELTMDSPDTGNSFTITRNSDGTVDYTCTAAGTAGCPGSGGGTGTWAD